MSKKRPIAVGRRRRITPLDIIITIFMCLFAILCLYPFVNQILISFASQADYYNSTLFVIPRHFNVDSYKYILFHDKMGQSFLVSISVSTVGTAYSMILTILGAYVLSIKDLPGKRAFFIFILITVFFGGGLIPFYLTVRELGLINSIASIIIPFGINTFNMIILRNFFKQIPQEMIESCKIDGANDFIILTRFILPLSKAGLATIALFYFVERWNDWYWPMMFLDHYDLIPMALQLRNILAENQSTGTGGGGGVDPGTLFNEGKHAATIVISMIPILAVYPFVQKYFVKGVMMGSVKT
ncbi:MAG: L-arabinose transport system permease protein AraQ [Tenericutes bacterium ADurb.Bin239]|jgi:putative aldouronate transport system permease protein|nr:MAG: L-arabinose transport system permease protein AraQ [Tenericutes bacterium ADurb.Bin239]